MAHSPKDFLDNYFSYGIDMRRRRIFIREDVTEDSIGILVQSLKLLEEDGKPIEIWLSSYGGEAYEMFAAFDVIRNSKAHIVMVANGKIMSAGTLILSAGDERKCFPHTLFMAHELSHDSPYQSVSTHENDLKHSKELMDQYYECMASRTNKTAKQWKQFIGGKADRFFTAEKALEYGLIDEIIEID